jgi:predicted RNA-binding protein YlxR (DUF448 family)
MRILNAREDLLTRARHPKKEMLRFVLAKGALVIDEAQILKGRGFYLQKSELTEALEKKAFNRALHRPLSEKEEEALRKL